MTTTVSIPPLAASGSGPFAVIGERATAGRSAGTGMLGAWSGVATRRTRLAALPT
jgi:hypothetical protein